MKKLTFANLVAIISMQVFLTIMLLLQLKATDYRYFSTSSLFFILWIPMFFSMFILYAFSLLRSWKEKNIGWKIFLVFAFIFNIIEFWFMTFQAYFKLVYPWDILHIYDWIVIVISILLSLTASTIILFNMKDDLKKTYIKIISRKKTVKNKK